MKVIQKTVSGLEIGEPVIHGMMAMFPLRPGDAGSPERGYLTLDEALGANAAEVGEISEAGSVPNLLFSNRGARPVLLIEGEELVGARQNRTLNVSILAPPGKETVIPVTCVEQGRWGYDDAVPPGSGAGDRPQADRSSRGSDRMAFGRMRRTHRQAVNASMAAEPASRDTDQGRTWNQIGDRMRTMAAPSPTSAMSDVYERHRKALDSYVGAFPKQPGQLGAVFFVGPDFAGVDAFAHEETFAALLPKLLRSYALDALELEERAPFRPSAEAARRLMDGVAAATTHAAPGVGMGEDVRIESPEVAGGALVVDGAVLHLSAFGREPERSSSDPGGYRRASSRRAARFSR